MSDSPPLTAALQRHFGALSRKQQAVARVLAEDPTFVSFASVAELAARADVDPATVVRTCQRLGYAGWTDLQAQVRRDLSRRRTFAERVSGLDDSGDEDLVHRIFAAALGNVSETLEELDRDALDAAARAIAGAGSTLVAASGVSHGPGLFLMSSLQLLGRPASLSTGAPDAGPALGALKPQDVVVAISVWRYLRSTIEVLELARELGATTVTVTDSDLSPAASIADHVLVARTVTAGPRLGLAGIVTMLEALVAQVAAQDPEAAVAATARADRLYFGGHVLADGETPETGGVWPPGKHDDDDD